MRTMGQIFLFEGREHFFVVAEGDSMHPKIQDGDEVLCIKTDRVESGDIAVITYDGEGYIREYNTDGETVTLRPINSAYPEITVKASDVSRFSILGEAISTTRKVY